MNDTELKHIKNKHFNSRTRRLYFLFIFFFSEQEDFRKHLFCILSITQDAVNFMTQT